MLNLFITSEYIDLFLDKKETMPFELEIDQWNYVDNLQKADVIPIRFDYMPENYNPIIKKLFDMGYNKDKQYILLLDIFHIDETAYPMQHYKTTLKHFHNHGITKINIVHTFHNFPTYIYYDFLFNREKAFITDYNKFNLSFQNYTLDTTIKTFKLNPIVKKETRLGNDSDGIFHYLCPNRIYDFNLKGEFNNHYLVPRARYRQMLKTYLSDNNFGKFGWLSDPYNGNVLSAEEDNLNARLASGGGNWFPIANRYYESSYFSVYVETITCSSPNVRSITEKTWDPLIKGHFILPFSYSGIISDLQNQGFKFPSWIDYSYDNIIDDDIRFLEFLKSLHKLLRFDLNKLHELYENDLYILKHNRKLFWEKPYYPLYNNVLKWINSN